MFDVAPLGRTLTEWYNKRVDYEADSVFQFSAMPFSEHAKPRFSKKAVNRAGDILVDDPINEEALEVLDYWRELHADMFGREHDFRLPFGTVATRIKRTVSIVEKLRRYPSMKLSRMQDIAGMRVVVDVSTQTSAKLFQGSVAEFQNIFRSDACMEKSSDDYIRTPKTSGYRAVHLIYEHGNETRPVYNGLLFEIQFRTKLQHLWAMAVETVGMFYGQALKASRGDQDWLDFFRLASAAFSHIERAPVVAALADKSFEQIRSDLRRDGNEKTFFSKLAAIKEVDETYSSEEYDYWLLELNIKKGENKIFGFKSDQIETAHEMYSAKEQTPACQRGDVQVVLVSTQSFKDLREAYPSYFLDVAEFTKTIKNICLKGTVEG